MRKVLELTKIKALKKGFEITCVNRFDEDVIFNIEDDDFSLPAFCKNNNIDTSLYEEDTAIDEVKGGMVDLNFYLGHQTLVFDIKDYIFTQKWETFKNSAIETQKAYTDVMTSRLHPYYYKIKMFIDSYKRVIDTDISTDFDFWQKYNSNLITREINRIKLQMLDVKPAKPVKPEKQKTNSKKVFVIKKQK